MLMQNTLYFISIYPEKCVLIKNKYVDSFILGFSMISSSMINFPFLKYSNVLASTIYVYIYGFHRIPKAWGMFIKGMKQTKQQEE